MKSVLSPYLTFDGNAKEAMQFYQSVLGGELTMQTFGENGMGDNEALKDKIIHADLKNEGLSFMASDGGDHPVEIGNNVTMSIVGDDLEKLTEYFEKLSEGGKVDLPFEKQFWGDTYGQLTDKFGVHWSVNVVSLEHKAE